MTAYRIVNPATGRTVREYPEATDEQIQHDLIRSHGAFLSWRRSAIDDRVAVLRRVAGLYSERRVDLAAKITAEMGKPTSQAQGEIDIAVSIYTYYADNGRHFLEDEELDIASGGSAVIHKEPVGPLIGIMPWNYPYYQVARFAAPNLMLGNTILLKHAPSCPSSALAMEQIFEDAGLPEGAYINVFATNDQVAAMIADPRVQGVSLTGSERAGSAVAEIAGRNLKKVVLELGGSDPFLLLDTANVEQTVHDAMVARMGNAGQACNAAKRFIVMEDLYDQFVEKLAAAVSAIAPGNPQDVKTFMGPMASLEAVASLAEQVDDAVSKGANVRTGGRQIDGDGAYYEPTVLTDVTPEMRAFREELFGPAAVVYRVSSEDEAIELANNSPFGLGASVYSADPDRAVRVAHRLDAGMVYINEAGGTAAELPFGGVKRSGVGRELGRYGMEEFANKKLIRITAQRPRGGADGKVV